MVSQTAIKCLDDLKAKGLSPSYEDVIRLNALGLRLEAVKGKRLRDSTWTLPRVAAVSRDVSFRQPTIGHDIWLAKAERWIEPGDYQSLLAVECYALSRPWTDLPDPDDPAVIVKSVTPYLEKLRDFTREQLAAAVSYALFGADATVGVHAAAAPREDAEEDDIDIDECVAVGLLNEGRAILSGVTAADMKSMTARELHDTLRNAYVYQGLSTNGEADRLEDGFFRTYDEIEKRLEREAKKD